MSEIFTVRITFTEDCLGTASNNPELQAEFIASKAPDAASREEEIAAIGVEAAQEKQMTVFPRDDHGNPIFYDYQIQGFFKEACSMLQRCKGEEFSKASCALKAYRKVIVGCIFPGPRKIQIHLPEGGKIGDRQRPLRGQTPQGETISLARSETVPAGSYIDVTIECLSKDYKPAVLEWLDYGKYHGLGQWRNGGNGRFTWQFIEG